MPSDKDTLVVPLTREEKRALKAASKTARKKMTAVAREALMAYVTGNLKGMWPAPAPDGRRKPTKKPTPLPQVKPQDFVGHSRAWCKLMRANGPEQMSKDVYLLIEAHYQAAKAKAGPIGHENLKSYWRDVSLYRHVLEQGGELPTELTEVDRNVIPALWRLVGSHRKAREFEQLDLTE